MDEVIFFNGLPKELNSIRSLTTFMRDANRAGYGHPSHPMYGLFHERHEELVSLIEDVHFLETCNKVKTKHNN